MSSQDLVVLPPVVTPARLAEIMRDRADVRLLDVRTPGEYEGGHIPSSYNVPLDTLAEHGAELRTVDEPIILICRSGQRARRAEAALGTSGMNNLHVLEGGMLAWEASGLQMNRARERWSLERQVRLVAGSIVFAGTVAAAVVSPWFLLVPGLVGGGLAAAAVADTCVMGMVLARLPYNQTTCDVGAMVSALKQGSHSSQWEGS